MSTAQATASNRFIDAMGAMHQPLYPQITQSELDKNGMPLHLAMNLLREKARAFYQA